MCFSPLIKTYDCHSGLCNYQGVTGKCQALLGAVDSESIKESKQCPWPYETFILVGLGVEVSRHQSVYSWM